MYMMVLGFRRTESVRGNLALKGLSDYSRRCGIDSGVVVKPHCDFITIQVDQNCCSPDHRQSFLSSYFCIQSISKRIKES